MLEVQHLEQYYGGSHILRDVSLAVPKGAVTVLLGRNGVGKTTLLKSLMGLVSVRSGHIRLNGQALDGTPPYARARAGMGYVPQGREIFARLTVAENLKMGLATQPSQADIPEDLLALFPILAQMMARRGGDLSGGQQQ
ncbi:MAG: ATP-binding cassette domain-containing protein, partial [Limnohabitans sp.]|nr:ATP-binding cassette domain-containing protein [Limnohabitans sp.]